MAEKKTKSEYVIKRLAEKAAARRKKAKEEKAFFDLNQKVAKTDGNLKHYKTVRGRAYEDSSGPDGWRRQANSGVANMNAEFPVGPLSAGESRTYGRAKRAVAREARKKRNK